MRLLRYLLVSGSAALMVGTLTLTATGGAAPAGTSHVAQAARFVSAARNALARYLRHYRPAAHARRPSARAG